MKKFTRRIAPVFASFAVLLTLTACNPDDFAVVKPTPEATSTTEESTETPIPEPTEATEAPAEPTEEPEATVEPAPAPEPSEKPETFPAPTPAGLDSITIAPAGNMGGYDRDSYNWRDDVDNNGCDTRNDILARDLDNVVRGDDGCKVVSGTLTVDPYNGGTINFTSEEYHTIDIDHIIPLADAHISGADDWDEATKTQFANDPRNLVAVNASDNRSKSNSSAADWLPDGNHCWYAETQVEVKAEYNLTMTQAEYDTLAGILAEC